MRDKYRIGIAGFAHPHINHVASLFAAHPRAEWVACADTLPLRPELRDAPYSREWNRRNVMRLAGIPKCYPDYREMLAAEKLDAVVVACENARHPEVVEACARAGISVCVEKPMAMSLEDARRMACACRTAGVAMVVNWPCSWLPHARKAKELIDGGAIGRPLEIHYRVGHSGPFGPGAQHKTAAELSAPMTGQERGATWLHQTAAGGGAMLDLCCYGAMYGLWYTGESATAAIGMRANLDSPWADADDNGVMVVRFPHAIAVAQGSWTTLRKSYLDAGPLVVYGSEGTLWFEIYPEKPAVCVEHGPGKPVEICAPDPLPAGRANLAQALLHHLETGEPVHRTLTVDFNLEVTAILEAGMRSADGGRLETVRA
ncbi:MAG: Gfo/Idh/MocA family oxidoreductase [Acidobacteria bacterium]|nr:Gfo/Idh/MocA family oxidoreductase [Acidobacteriota bacterium]MCL5744958.1 Gfo/Idh/MocA family oxidoreductase [Acidobacteriota bacterium]